MLFSGPANTDPHYERVFLLDPQYQNPAVLRNKLPELPQSAEASGENAGVSASEAQRCGTSSCRGWFAFFMSGSNASRSFWSCSKPTGSEPSPLALLFYFKARELRNNSSNLSNRCLGKSYTEFPASGRKSYRSSFCAIISSSLFCQGGMPWRGLPLFMMPATK